MVPEEKGKLTILKKFDIIYIEGWGEYELWQWNSELREWVKQWIAGHDNDKIKRDKASVRQRRASLSHLAILLRFAKFYLSLHPSAISFSFFNRFQLIDANNGVYFLHSHSHAKLCASL